MTSPVTDFEEGPFVRGRNLNIAASAMKAVRQEDLPDLLAETLMLQYGYAKARSMLETALKKLNQ